MGGKRAGQGAGGELGCVPLGSWGTSGASAPGPGVEPVAQQKYLLARGRRRWPVCEHTVQGTLAWHGLGLAWVEWDQAQLASSL